LELKRRRDESEKKKESGTFYSIGFHRKLNRERGRERKL